MLHQLRGGHLGRVRYNPDIKYVFSCLKDPVSSSALPTELSGVIVRPKFNAILAHSVTPLDRPLELTQLRESAEVITPDPLAPSGVL